MQRTPSFRGYEKPRLGGAFAPTILRTGEPNWVTQTAPGLPEHFRPQDGWRECAPETGLFIAPDAERGRTTCSDAGTHVVLVQAALALEAEEA